MKETVEIEVPILDREILDHHTMQNKALQRELFALFFEQAPNYIESLRQAVECGCRDDWHMTAHGVKGAARSLGLTRLAVLAQRAETSEPSREILADLERIIEMTRTHLPKLHAA